MIIRSEPPSLTITLQDSEDMSKYVDIKMRANSQRLSIRPTEYGKHRGDSTKNTPIGIDFIKGKLRIVIFPKINSTVPKVIMVDLVEEPE